MTKNILFVLLALSFASCSVSKDIEVSSGARVSDRSIIYALPQTTLAITLEATKTILKKGIYAEYAEKYLHIRNVPVWDSQTWAITNTKIETVNEADPTNYYTITYKTYPENLDKLFSVSDKGIILDFANSWKNNLSLTLPHEKTDSTYDPRILREPQSEKIDTFYKTIVADSSFRRIPVIKKQIIAKTPEDEAKETATLILKIRKSRIDLLRGKLTYPPDGSALTTNLAELNKLENMYLAMFMGIKIQEKQTFTYYITPKKDMVTSQLCYFSADKGVQAQSLPGTKLISLQLIKGSDIPAASQASNKTLNLLYFRIPVMINALVGYNNDNLASQRVLIYQFGAVQTIPLR